MVSFADCWPSRIAATITAVTPEAWTDSASTKAAYGVTRAITDSSTGSSVRIRTTATPADTTTPTSVPPTASSANSPMA